MGVTVPISGGRVLEFAVPAILEPRDVFAGDELHMIPGDAAAWARYHLGEPMPTAAWKALDQEFRRLYPAVLAGRAPAAELARVAAAMGLDRPVRHDSRPPRQCAAPLDDALLADLALDNIPDLGALAPDRVLGPFADLRPSRETRTAAAAVLAFARIVPPAQRAIDRFQKALPHPSVGLRWRVRCVEMCPPMLWQRQGDGLRPMFPLAPRFQVPGPVSGLPDSDAILGRLVPLEGGGAFLSCGLPLPSIPDPGPILRRLHWELWRMRRHELRLTWEDLLRERGEVLYRTCFESCWRDLGR